jgi:RNA polymerase sigma-70 factor, ECF subfamily
MPHTPWALYREPVSRAGAKSSRTDEGAAAEAVRAGDESAFTQLTQRYRNELRVHCYRMLGSFDEAEDLVQETFLRAWRSRDRFEGRSTFRAWLYRIATNACLDFLDKHPRQPQPRTVEPGAAALPDAIPWLQPYPDQLLEFAAPSGEEPDAAVVAKETIELAFLAAIQHLSPKQRAALILRDVLGWPAKDTAALVDASVASVNSALDRARATLKERLPRRRMEWAPSSDPTGEERALLRRYMDVAAQSDVTALAELLREDALLTMPPHPIWVSGRDSILAFVAQAHDPQSPIYLGDWHAVPTSANRQPAVAGYVRRPDDTVFRGQLLDVLRIEDGRIAEITTFDAHLFPTFGLPLTLPP